MFNNRMEPEKPVKLLETSCIEAGVINFTNALEIEEEKTKFVNRRRTPFVVTLDDPEIKSVELRQLLEAGMNIVRLRHSHLTTEAKIELLGKINNAAENLCAKYAVEEWPVATCIDLKTCVIKTGLLEGEEDRIPIMENSEIILTNNKLLYDKCNINQIYVDVSDIVSEIAAGSEIYIDADEIVLRCKNSIDETSVLCVVTKAGSLGSMVNVCARGRKYTMPLISAQDKVIMKFAMDHDVDMVTINYVRHPDAVKIVKQCLGLFKRPLIFSSICCPNGLENIDGIIKESDGIILSREFLPYELPEAHKGKWIMVQKYLAGKCQSAGKPFFLFGGVFQDAVMEFDMVKDSEVADVTNAILEGVTGFILRDCTNIKATVKALSIMSKICKSVERLTDSVSKFSLMVEEVKMPVNAAVAAVFGCVAAAIQCNARVIILPTSTGKTLKTLFCMQPPCLVLTVSHEMNVLRLLKIYGWVLPLKYRGPRAKNCSADMENRIKFAVAYAVKNRYLAYGDMYVTLQRIEDDSNYCDAVRIWKTDINRETVIECEETPNVMF